LTSCISTCLNVPLNDRKIINMVDVLNKLLFKRSHCDDRMIIRYYEYEQVHNDYRMKCSECKLLMILRTYVHGIFRYMIVYFDALLKYYLLV
jgi:hypothetical protein